MNTESVELHLLRTLFINGVEYNNPILTTMLNDTQTQPVQKSPTGQIKVLENGELFGSILW